MLKLRQHKTPIAAGLILSVLALGTILVVKSRWLEQQSPSHLAAEIRYSPPRSVVLSLVPVPASVRQRQMETIATLPSPSLDRARARYLLATDFLQNNQPAKALDWLNGLEREYPVLAPYIALHRAQAYALSQNQIKAKLAWQDLLKRYPQQAVAAEALFVLGQTQPKYWQQAIAQFPAAPRTQEIARKLLQQNPHQPKLLLLLAKYAYDQPNIISVLDSLVSQAATQLKSSDWEVIGFAYWQNHVYAKAGAAYSQAPKTPLNLYRAARGLQLGQQRLKAIAAYQKLVSTFPHAPETGMGLLHLAELSPVNDALNYLEQVISRFPKHAGEALLNQAKILESVHKSKPATEALQRLLVYYADSDAAAQYRWQVAQARAAVGDYQAACNWAEPIFQHHPQSILAPKAGFWIGKWQNQLRKPKDARATFVDVLAKFPQSYYAWRSATALGLDVGKFTTLPHLALEIVLPSERPLLPAGSNTLKELYQLGQNLDAWNLWRAQFSQRTQPTVAEQFTDGLLHSMIGENLIGISQLATLADEDSPAKQAQYEALRQMPAYWYGLYPLPFLPIVTHWSQQRQLNPLLVTALIRQESGFDPQNRSPAGALGLMQLVPSTAQWIATKIKLKQYDLENPDDNIRLGTWYLNYTTQAYDNNALLAVASYNAGPGNVDKWLKQFHQSDPDEFVEAIPFAETKNYVQQVFGNYWNYLRLYNPQISQFIRSVHSMKASN